MTTELYLSRNFVEFGPFSDAEITAFAARGIVNDSDFIKAGGGGSWLPYADWLASLTPPAPPPGEAAAPAKKKAAKKKTAA